ncbi:MAG: DeoR/GlpR transcriptional regulator [Ruminococcaceae bacterium]|nr:DeoR/GlpR transcriptional regulator [Oscillospiraceae bacterium]
MLALERQKRILEILNADGSVLVSKLSEELDVTEETIRRDLEKLEKQEVLIRTHGGAVPVDENDYELSLEKRKNTNITAKEKLAKEAVKFVKPWDTIFLDASTTTFYMAKEIKKMQNVTVITNSVRVINELSGLKDVKVIGIGGLLSQNQSFVGSLAEDTIEKNYFANKMFFSSKGIMEEDTWVLESNEQECAIKQKMIKNSTERYFICDKSKIGRVGFVKLLPFEKINYFITDYKPSEKWIEIFKEESVEVVEVE